MAVEEYGKIRKKFYFWLIKVSAAHKSGPKVDSFPTAMVTFYRKTICSQALHLGLRIKQFY